MDTVCCLQAAWLAYFEVMKTAGYNSTAPLYVASGLLTYMNASGECLGSWLMWCEPGDCSVRTPGRN